MKIIGLTGGIGSGKSTVASIFSYLGIAVYDSDYQAKKLYSDTKVQSAVMALLGANSYVNGIPDNAFISSKVFSDLNVLSQLNAIIHPAVKLDFANWALERKRKRDSWILKESALLIETKAYEDCDSIITVCAPEEMRIHRVMRRNSITREEVKRRVENQIKEDDRIPFADFIITNDEKSFLIPQILKIFNHLNSSLGNSNS